jgi:hydrogenase maturation factor
MTVEPGICITCGDVALALTVVTVEGGDAVCRAQGGGTQVVAIDLVAPVEPGDRILVHARVALEKLGERADDMRFGEPSLRGDGR